MRMTFNFEEWRDFTLTPCNLSTGLGYISKIDSWEINSLKIMYSTYISNVTPNVVSAVYQSVDFVKSVVSTEAHL